MAGAGPGEGHLSGLCLAAGAAAVRLAVTAFTLAWVHSVERTAIEEDWRVEGNRLVVVEARVKGSGAGITVPEGALLVDGFWRYRPVLPPLPEIVLARSGVVADWRLCVHGYCRPIGELAPADAPTLTLRACPPA